MPTIDTSHYYVIKNLFAPGRALTNVSGGWSVQLTPGPPTTWAQLWTELWAFQWGNLADYYLIKSISGGSSYLSFDPSTNLVCFDSYPRLWKLSYVNYTLPSGAQGDPVASFGTGFGNPSLSTDLYLAYSNAGSYMNYANVVPASSFCFQKYWQLSKTAIPV